MKKILLLFAALFMVVAFATSTMAHCAGCSVSSDTSKNTGSCISCGQGTGDQCITGDPFAGPSCSPSPAQGGGPGNSK